MGNLLHHEFLAAEIHVYSVNDYAKYYLYHCSHIHVSRKVLSLCCCHMLMPPHPFTHSSFVCSVAVLAVRVRVAAGVAGDGGGVPAAVDAADGRHGRPRRRPRLPLLLLRQPAPPALPRHGNHVG